MRPVLAASLAALLGLSAAPAFAADAAQDAAALKPVHAFIAGTNSGDVTSAAAVFAPDAVILDEFPPYRWLGPDAYAHWEEGFAKAAKDSVLTDAVITLEAPHKLEITGAHAYAVIPALYDYKDHGHPVREHGTFTFALTKGTQGWRIAGWSWSWVSDSK